MFYMHIDINFGGGYSKGEYLSKEDSLSLKGICAMLILAHHIYQSSNMITVRSIGFIFQYIGYVVVAVFLFLSGYGLQASASCRDDYIRNFPISRILPFYVSYVVVILLYYTEYILLGADIIWSKVLLSFFIGDTIVSGGWYIQTQLLIYLIFWLVYRFCGRAKVKILTAIVLGFCLIGFFVNLPFKYYAPVPAFLIGVYWREYQEEISRLLRNNQVYLSVTIAEGCILGAGVIGCHISTGLRFIIFRMVIASTFAILVALLAWKIKIRGAVTHWLGEHSFEIYMSQGLFLILYRNDTFYLENGWIYIVSVVTSSLLASLYLHPLIRWIYSKIGKKVYTN